MFVVNGLASPSLKIRRTVNLLFLRMLCFMFWNIDIMENLSRSLKKKEGGAIQIYNGLARIKLLQILIILLRIKEKISSWIPNGSWLVEVTPVLL